MKAFSTCAAALLLFATVGCAVAPRPHLEPRAHPLVFAEPSRNTITFWGHACAYIDLGGIGIVTDPVFESSYAIFHPRRIPAPPPEAYDHVRLVLISHAHQDHLSRRTLARFSPDVVILCPPPAARYLAGLERDVRVMRPGEEFCFPGGSIIAVPAHHPGGRYSRKARADGRALGYVIRSRGLSIYYSGDTDYFPGIERIGTEYRPDIALLNINVHLHSYDAILAVAALGVPKVVPLHWGAYGGSRAARSLRWRRELSEALGSVVVPVGVGQTLPLPPGGSDDAR